MVTTAKPAVQTDIAKSERRGSFWLVMKRVMQIAAAVDVVFFGIFLALDSRLLAWVNVISVAMYIYAYYSIDRRRNNVAIAIIWIEVLAHATLGTALVGWDSGFHYYLLVFVPAIFVSTNVQRGVNAALFLWGWYVGLDLMANAMTPIEPLLPAALEALRYFNFTVVFIMLAYLSAYYYRTIIHVQDKLRRLAITDPLTGMYNRRHILDLANYEAVQQKRGEAPLAFVIGDIDHFKAINDTYGHEAGDAALVVVSQAIRASVREQDSSARWGGEEFLIVLPNTDLPQAAMVAERIREKVAAARVTLERGSIGLTMTLGVAVYREGEPIRHAIARADALLYEGKKNGRNRVESHPD